MVVNRAVSSHGDRKGQTLGRCQWRRTPIISVENGYHEFRGMQTAAMWRRCNNRPVWAVWSPHTTGRFLLTIIATASRTEPSIMATPPESVEIYCLKCRIKTGSRDVEQVTMKNGRPALRAVCTVCGTGKYRIGSAG